MINEETYKRLTAHKLTSFYDWERENLKPEQSAEIYDRLADLEDKIENGTLTELTCKGIEELDVIKKGMVFIFYKMCLEQNLGQGFFLEYKSKINEWFKNYLKNKELQGEIISNND